MNEVTARKWRPKLFKDFVGQDYIIHSLKQSLKESKVAHGYLFSGPRGIGKTSSARVFATALNCLNLTSSYEPCLECKNCKEIREGHSPDVIEIDGASNRGIDDMREMRSNIQFMPTYSHYKIYIIDEVHMLTTEAFNAILKVLEEPPTYIIFMFATTEIHKVKSTIRSRCQQFYLKRLTESQISEQLAKICDSYKLQYKADALNLIAKAADGSMRDSQSILDQAIIFSEGDLTEEKVKEILGIVSYQELLKFIQILISQNGKEMKLFAQDLYTQGEDLSFFILQLIDVLKSLLLVHYGAEDLIDVSDDIKEQLITDSHHFNKYQLQTLIDMFMDLFKDMKDTDHEYFLLEGAFLKSLQYKNFVNLGDIIDRISALESYPQDISLIEEQKASVKMEPSSDTALEHQNGLEVFYEWKKTLSSPRDQKIMLDMKSVEYKNATLSLEFLTKEGLASFKAHKQLQESLQNLYQQKQIPINIKPFVHTVNLAKGVDSPLIQPKTTIEPSLQIKADQDIVNMFITELDAKEIKGN